MTSKYSKKVQITLTEEDFNLLETMVNSSRLTTGQMASTLVENEIQEYRNTLENESESGIAQLSVA